MMKMFRPKPAARIAGGATLARIVFVGPVLKKRKNSAKKMNSQAVGKGTTRNKHAQGTQANSPAPETRKYEPGQRVRQASPTIPPAKRAEDAGRGGHRAEHRPRLDAPKRRDAVRQQIVGHPPCVGAHGERHRGHSQRVQRVRRRLYQRGGCLPAGRGRFTIAVLWLAAADGNGRIAKDHKPKRRPGMTTA